MKKNLIYLIHILGIVTAMLIPVGAADLPIVYDEADLLTDYEESALTEKLSNFSTYNQMEVVVAVLNSTYGYSPMEYADNFYDYNNYGYGADKSGLILIVVMDSREWWISTCGSAINVFTDAGIEYIGEQIVTYLSNGDYAGAFDEFADQCGVFIAQAENGEPYDYYNLPKVPFDVSGSLIIAVAAGLIIALIYTGTLKSQLKTVRAQRNAENYLRNGSMNVTRSSDMFLYRKVNRTPRQNGSSSRGGSRTHVSSSGRSHGGGGGRF